MSHFSYAPLFQGPHFLTKMLESNISMIIYLLPFYLFDNIEKKYWDHSCESFCYSKAILTNFEKCTCKRNVLIFYFCFVLGIIHGDRGDRKTPKTKGLFKKKKPFSVIEFSNTVTFWRNARLNVKLTSVTVIKLGFLLKLFCNKSLVDIEVSKH